MANTVHKQKWLCTQHGTRTIASSGLLSYANMKYCEAYLLLILTKASLSQMTINVTT